MTNIGDLAGVIFSLTANPAEGSGDNVYLVAEKIELPYKSLSKITNSAAGYNYSNRDGKRDWSVKIKNAYVMAYGANTLVQSFNLYTKFFKDQTKVGATPIYLYIAVFAADGVTISDYIELGDGVDYLKGYATVFPAEKEEGLYKFTEITFRESN